MKILGHLGRDSRRAGFHRVRWIAAILLTLLGLGLIASPPVRRIMGWGKGWGKAAPTPLTAEGVRRFPFPYRAGLTLTSDVDSCSRQEYLEIHQFLNTREDTAKNGRARPGAAMGVGVGLELGDSFFPYTDYDSGGWTFTLFKDAAGAPGGDADLIRTWAQAGYVDVMHSFGDFSKPGAFKRPLALAALDYMKKAGMDISVFVDHGSAQNTNNIGKDWKGDVPGAAEYHTDRSVFPHGPIRFISDGACTSTVGFAPLRPIRLRDGAPAYAFTRYYDVKEGWNVNFLYRQLSPAHLDALTFAEESWVIANHLGLVKGGGNALPVFGPENQAALRDLEWRARAGQIYVTTAAKMLWYLAVRQGLRGALEHGRDGSLTISIQGVNDPVFGFFVPGVEQLQGITLYTDRPERTRVLLAGADVTPRLRRNPPDQHGKASLTFPLQPLPPLPEWTSDGLTRKSETYEIKDYHYTFSVTNLGDKAFAPTLTYIGLHPFTLREATAGGGARLEVLDGRRLRLPPLRPGQTLEGIQARGDS